MTTTERPSSFYWQLDGFNVYPEQRILQDNDGNDLAVEPRVIDALSLLCERQGEYVTTSALMELIWEGRIVSDAAVRGTIRKLRAALGDNTKQPNYIQSSPKRGYRLIKQADRREQVKKLSKKDIFSKDENCIENQVEELSPEVTFPHFVKHKSAVNKLIFLIGFAAVLITALMVVLHPAVDTDISPLDGFQPKVIHSLPGDKYDFSVSDDGRWIAFTGRLDTHDIYQLYLIDTKLNEISQLSNSKDNITDLAFFNGDNSLAYVELAFQTSNLYVIDNIVNGEKRNESRQILKNYRSIGELVGHPVNNQLFVSLGSNDGSISRLHLLDIESGQLTPVSKITNANETDSLAKISPDNQYIANVTFQDGNNSVVSIINVNNYQVIKRFNLDYHPQDIAWKIGDSSAKLGHLLLINGQRIELLSISDGSSESYDNPGYQKLISSKSQKNYYAIDSVQYDSSRRVFIRQDVHLPSVPGTLLNTSENTKELYFLNSQYFLELTSSDNTQTLIVTSLKGDKIKTLYSSQKKIKILARSDSLGQLLFSDGEQLLLINTLDFTVAPVTSAAQYVTSGSFDLSGNRIIYAEQKAGRWQLILFDPKTKHSKSFLDNYRFAIPLSDHYIAMNEDEELYLLNENFNVVKDISDSVRSSKHSNIKDRELSIPLDLDCISEKNDNNCNPQFIPTLSPDGNSVIIPLEHPHSAQISILIKP